MELENKCCSDRKICHANGTGEQVLMFQYKSIEGMEKEFEYTVQQIAHGFYNMETGVSDIKVCHPKEGEVAFCITFTGKDDMELFKKGPGLDAWLKLRDLVINDGEGYLGGCLMPDTHTLSSLMETLKKMIVGKSAIEHDVAGVREQICKWYPREEEWSKFVHWDEHHPEKYTRNLMFATEHFDAILMCWPPGCSSTIHDHDESSCWAFCVEGQVKEIQYHTPKFDRCAQTGGSVQRCTPLKRKCVSLLNVGDCAYVTNEIGLHRVCNPTDKPAYTMHVYAPGLRKFKIFVESGNVSINTLAQPPMTSFNGIRSEEADGADPDGVIDIEAWNEYQRGRQYCPTDTSTESQ